MPITRNPLASSGRALLTRSAAITLKNTDKDAIS